MPEREPKNEFIPPTEADVINLEVEVDNLGSGNTVHNIKGRMAFLKRAFNDAKKNGWNKDNIEDWNTFYKGVKDLIVERKMELAKEKDLI